MTDRPDWFQSSPGFLTGCELDAVRELAYVAEVSILTRLLDRVRGNCHRRDLTERDDKGEVSILTRLLDRVRVGA